MVRKSDCHQRKAQGQTAFKEQSTNVRQQAASRCGLDQPDLGQRAPLPVIHAGRILATTVLYRAQRIMRHGQVAIRQKNTDPRQFQIDRLLGHGGLCIDERTPFFITREVTTGIIRQFARTLDFRRSSRSLMRRTSRMSNVFVDGRVKVCLADGPYTVNLATALMRVMPAATQEAVEQHREECDKAGKA